MNVARALIVGDLEDDSDDNGDENGDGDGDGDGNGGNPPTVGFTKEDIDWMTFESVGSVDVLEEEDFGDF